MHTIYNTQYTNESKHSEMGPVRQNPIQRTVSLFICVCASHCVQLLHTILRRTDLIISNLTLQTITTAPMMSIWGKGAARKHCGWEMRAPLEVRRRTILILIGTRTVQPVATCRKSPNVHKPAIPKLLLLIYSFQFMACFPCNDHAQPAKPTSVADTLASPTHSWTHLWN